MLYWPGAESVGLLGDGLSWHLPRSGECAALLFRKGLARAGKHPVRLVVCADGNRSTRVYLPYATSGLLPEAIRRYQSAGVKRVSVMLGTGDSLHNGFANGEYESNLQAIVSTLVAAEMNVILHTPPYAYSPKHGWCESPEDFSLRHQRAINPLINSHTVFRGDTDALSIFAQRLNELTEDGIHASATGAIVLADSWVNAWKHHLAPTEAK